MDDRPTHTVNEVETLGEVRRIMIERTTELVRLAREGDVFTFTDAMGKTTMTVVKEDDGYILDVTTEYVD